MLIGVLALVGMMLIGEYTKPDYELECREGCASIDKQYFKYDFSDGGFGPDIRDCFCNNNGNIEQIW